MPHNSTPPVHYWGIIHSHLSQSLFRYAFVVHRTSRDATRNLQGPIDYFTLGPECRLEYARNSLARSSEQGDIDRKKLIVTGIPENVCENDLHHLFFNCRIIKYCPARTVHRTITERNKEDTSKNLWG